VRTFFVRMFSKVYCIGVWGRCVICFDREIKRLFFVILLQSILKVKKLIVFVSLWIVL
jgi:hypothetical protein